MAGVRKSGVGYEVFNTSNKRTLSRHATRASAKKEAKAVRRRNR